MSSPSSKARRAAQAAKVTARSAQSSGMIKCYVEYYERPDGISDLRLREKLTRRTVRVLADEPMLQQFAPMSNLLQDCYAHGSGLIEPRNRKEHVAIVAPIFTQNAQEIMVWLDDKFSVTVNILSAHISSPPAPSGATSRSTLAGTRVSASGSGRRLPAARSRCTARRRTT